MWSCKQVGMARYAPFWGAEFVGVVRIWSKVKVNFWPRSRVKAKNWGSKILTPVAGGSTESMQATSPCPATSLARIEEELLDLSESTLYEALAWRPAIYRTELELLLCW